MFLGGLGIAPVEILVYLQAEAFKKSNSGSRLFL